MPLRSQCGSVLAEQDLKSFQLLRLPQEFFLRLQISRTQAFRPSLSWKNPCPKTTRFRDLAGQPLTPGWVNQPRLDGVFGKQKSFGPKIRRTQCNRFGDFKLCRQTSAHSFASFFDRTATRLAESQAIDVSNRFRQSLSSIIKRASSSLPLPQIRLWDCCHGTF